MKNILVFIGILLFTGTMMSCGADEKATKEEENSTEINLIGKWKALENAEADGPMEQINDGVTITFTEDLHWSMAYNESEFAGGEYETQAGKVYCYVQNKQDENAPHQYVWEYYGEKSKLVLDGYYFKGNDKVNLKVILESL
ncbi:MAG: hypothetical protein H6599_04735 [Flavobacteriales bacterium]|nr:hypothetical protein [Flavobacteriales bacterium]